MLLEWIKNQGLGKLLSLLVKLLGVLFVLTIGSFAYFQDKLTPGLAGALVTIATFVCGISFVTIDASKIISNIKKP